MISFRILMYQLIIYVIYMYACINQLKIVWFAYPKLMFKYRVQLL
jgi:hypothetical protein